MVDLTCRKTRVLARRIEVIILQWIGYLSSFPKRHPMHFVPALKCNMQIWYHQPIYRPHRSLNIPHSLCDRFPFHHLTTPLALPKLFILHLPPIPLLRLIPRRLPRRVRKRRLPRIKLISLPTFTTPTGPFQFLTHSNRLVPAKPLPHIHHSAFTLAVSLFELLTLCRHGAEERLAETVGGFIAIDHYAVGGLEAGC